MKQIYLTQNIELKIYPSKYLFDVCVAVEELDKPFLRLSFTLLFRGICLYIHNVKTDFRFKFKI